MANSSSPILVIGAGVVGLASALYLQRSGREVVILDPLQQIARQLDAGKLLCTQARGQCREALLMQLHSITFGTRYRPASTRGAFS